MMLSLLWIDNKVVSLVQGVKDLTGMVSTFFTYFDNGV